MPIGHGQTDPMVQWRERYVRDLYRFLQNNPDAIAATGVVYARNGTDAKCAAMEAGATPVHLVSIAETMLKIAADRSRAGDPDALPPVYLIRVDAARGMLGRERKPAPPAPPNEQPRDPA